MCDYKEIIPIVWEEMAEEEDLFSSKPQPFAIRLYTTIDNHQVKVLEGVIISRAKELHCSPATLCAAFITAYQIEDLKELPGDYFDEAIGFLMDFNGIN